MSRPPSVDTTPVASTAASEASDNDLSERCPSVASDDTFASDLSSELPLRGSVPERGSPRGRGGRGGRRSSRRPPDSYPAREIVTDVTNQLYIWEDGQSIPCKLCMYEGKKVVEHYVTKHPNTEVLISRLERSEAMQSMQQSKSSMGPALQCRFCFGSFSNMNDFQDHVTEHTGEYRYSCMFCQYKKPRSSTVAQHLKAAHSSNLPPELLGKPIESKPHYLPGFLCGFCNFVQLNKEAVVEHISKRHGQESGGVCPPGLQELNEINMVRVDKVEEKEEPAPPEPVIKKELDAVCIFK